MKSSVLIADDEPLARRTLREHLLSLGWALDIVMPGAIVLQVLEHGGASEDRLAAQRGVKGIDRYRGDQQNSGQTDA